MPDVDLSPPDLEDVDPDAGRYKRAVAILVVLITLFGSAVAYLQSRESNDEDVAARDAQRFAVAGLGAQVDASADFAADLRIGTEIDTALQRQAINAARVDNFQGDAEGDAALAAAERFAAVRQAIADLTPIDPSDPSTGDAEFGLGNESADAARLRQAVEADRADDHGGKADAYVAVLTVLAVSLFLLGLSLTVQGRTRYVLAAPGVAIALVCVAWTALIASQDVARVSTRAVQAAAEGLRLQNAGDFEGAIDAYDRAIDDSPDFAIAYARRADARFVQGSEQIGQTSFLSITSPEALEAALDDLQAALDRGAGSDVGTLADGGFFTFLAGDFGRSAELSRQAIELNDQLAAVWFNLGVAEVARGDEDAAQRAYRQGRRLLEEAPDAFTRQNVLSGARTDLSILRELLDGDDLDDAIDLIEEVEADLAAFDAGFAEPPCPADLEPCPSAGAAAGAELGEAELVRDGAFVFATIAVDGAEPGAPVTNVWYVRTADDQPFQQAAFPLEVSRVGLDGTVFTSTVASFDPPCPVPGEYLVRAYAGDRFLGEVSAEVEEGPLGDRFTLAVDPIEGYEVCVPDGFTVERADVTDIDAFTFLGGPEFAIGLNVTPGALAEGIDPELLTEEVLVQLLGVDAGDLVEMEFNARDVDGVPFRMRALAGVSPDGQLATASGIGPDGASRNVTITGPSDRALLEEAVALITFTGLPPGSAG